MQRQPVNPGSVLGVFGGGQLGRMFAQAAARLGYRVHVFAPDADPPAAHVAWRHTQAAYDDLDAVRTFAQSVAAVTFEFENVPVATLAEAARFTHASPQPHVLEIAQQRAREKTFLKDNNLPVTPFALVRSIGDLESTVVQLGTPLVLKSIRGGYDGKGQQTITDATRTAAAWESLIEAGAVPLEPSAEPVAVAEAWVNFSDELSVIVARSAQGDMVTYGPMRNVHSRHILDYSVFPSGLDERVEHEAQAVAVAVVEALDLVGVCCVELFLTRGGDVLINEIAPRPHNSGHLTIEAHETSQFEQQVRTMCGLPLGGTQPIVPAAAMVNLLGDLWVDCGGVPDWAGVLARQDVALHLYGKPDAQRRRKMGHITARGSHADDALARASSARSMLVPSSAALGR